ncbi:hypothetical protein GCM10010289_62720 [Streptomyces violascens]|uniref:Uncharacterized protein n=1 Tax=Streptomyces violascens TaxID=67381 RepID=A0ABQ3QSG8_9ACTN|nr:hypothetical protein GCM10010289_62720 [Streptomyces violascens]GHI40213.1 hypothetical protein Sviol_46210 [Streptomyces violascens]
MAGSSRGTDETRVRDALDPLFTDADFTTGPVAGMYPERGQPGLWLDFLGPRDVSQISKSAARMTRACRSG